MPMRLSGLMSGMDTESIIQQLVEAKKTKVTKAVKAQKSLKYKQDAWKDLNKQIVNLYNKSLTTMRFQSSYMKKVTKVSNSNVVSVITGETAMNSVQSLTVDQLAKSGYLTGGQIGVAVDSDGKGVDKNNKAITSSTKLSDLGFGTGTGSFRVKTADGVMDISVDGDSTIGGFIGALKDAGLNANFDEANGRIHITSKGSGTKNDFSIIANDAAGWSALDALGLDYKDAGALDHYKSIFGNIDPEDPAAVNGKIEGDQREYLKKLTELRKALVDTEKDLLTKQNESLTQLKAKLADPDVKKEWDDALKDVNPPIDIDTLTAEEYYKLSDEQKQAFDTALQKSLDKVYEKALAAGGDTDTIKADLEQFYSDWKADESELNSTVASRKSLDQDLDIVDDGTFAGAVKVDPADPLAGLAATAKAAIADKINNAVTMYNKLSDSTTTYGAHKDSAADAKITLNGVEYTSNKNTFDINGLTLTVSATTAKGESVTITTEDDTNGIYDMVKNFFKEYNAVINQMDKLYNADAAKGYEPLTDEEKEAMSDSQIEEWENKIKDAALRKDGTLSTFASEMKRIMMEGVEVDGKKMYLANFGIGTLNYFVAADNERNAYHIDGDPDDENTANNPDKLKSMIANDPDTVVSFFTQLSQKMSDKMFDMMKSVEGVSSAMTAYEDKRMQTDYDNYTAKIKELEKKLADYEDKWYAKFAAMETALAKMQNNASAVTSLLGG
ncbi:MAG: flagellar filament capping protein FliD [Lachnospiraceae bacterium]|nr:flagellar filament capping protein FliD [uncultured Acetatifactor sp.]MCI9220725.1 flagellar filament capping protein FliD [Lachnospiraceae bacterium]